MNESIPQEKQTPGTRTDTVAGRHKPDAGAFYAANDRATIKREARSVMQAQGVYVKTAWVKRWDLQTATLLAYFVSYLGSQKDPDGWMYKSWSEVYEETGLTRSQQNRARRILEADDVIEVRTGGIGNKVHVLVNIELLKLIDGLPSVEEVEADERDAPEPARRSATPAPTRATPARGGATLARQRATHNRNTSNTSNTHQHQEPEPGSRRDARVVKCLGVLEEMVMTEKSREGIEAALRELVDQYPKLNHVDVCLDLLNYASTNEVKSPASLLRKFFATADEKRQAEPLNPLGAGTPVFTAPEPEPEPEYGTVEPVKLLIARARMKYAPDNLTDEDRRMLAKADEEVARWSER